MVSNDRSTYKFLVLPPTTLIWVRGALFQRILEITKSTNANVRLANRSKINGGGGDILGSPYLCI